MGKRILAYILVAVMLLIGTAWKLGLWETEKDTGVMQDSETLMQEGLDSESPVTITIAHYFGDTDTDETSKYVQNVIAQIQEEHPELKIEQIVCDNETYKDRLKILAATNELPDVMFGYGGGIVRVLAEKGKLLALDDYISEFTRSHMIEEKQTSFVVNGSRYGICYSDWIGLLYCNTEIFEQAGLTLPATYEELAEDCQVFSEMGITPIACGMLNQWMGQQWINNFTIQLGGTEYYEAIAEGKVSFDNEILEQAAQLTADLVEEEAFGPDVCNTTSAEAEELFLSGNAAMIYDGDWMAVNAENRLGEKVSVVQMPAVCRSDYPEDYHGGAVNGWMVSSASDYPEYSVMIAEELAYRLALYQPTRAAFILEGEDAVSENTEDTGESETETYGRELSDLERMILAIRETKTKGGLAYDTLLAPAEAENWLDMCWELFQGDISGREFVETLERRAEENGDR